METEKVESDKSGRDAFFLLAGVAGFVVIFFSEAASGEFVYLAPTAIVLVYALITGGSLRECEDRTLAEHHIDSIYFLGFLFTLFSLVTLFFRLHNGSLSGAELLSRVVVYVGISVSTSIAGILFRSIARGAYLSRHPERSVDTIEAFLAEREATTRALKRKETQYLKALDRYVEATSSFSEGLGQSQSELVPRVESIARAMEMQGKNLETFSSATARFAETAASMERRAATLPWEAVTNELDAFHQGVRELNLVLDSLITVLEHKVERVR
jgi:hypothetical protein